MRGGCYEQTGSWEDSTGSRPMAWEGALSCQTDVKMISEGKQMGGCFEKTGSQEGVMSMQANGKVL